MSSSSASGGGGAATSATGGSASGGRVTGVRRATGLDTGSAAGCPAAAVVRRRRGADVVSTRITPPTIGLSPIISLPSLTASRPRRYGADEQALSRVRRDVRPVY